MLGGHSPTGEKRSGGSYKRKKVAMVTEESAVHRQDVSKQSGKTVPKLGQGVTSTTTSLISSLALDPQYLSSYAKLQPH